MDSKTEPRLASVFTGRVAPLGAHQVPSAFVKTQVAGPVRAGVLGLAGDAQADLSVHGGVDKAVYAYPTCHYPRWKQDFPDVPIPWNPGSLGENLAVGGCSEAEVCIGDTVRLGTALLQVTQPRKPCFKLSLRFSELRLPKHMIDTGRSGWYYRVLQEGSFEAGECLALVARPYPAWTVRRVNDVSFSADASADDLRALAALPELSEAWRTQVQASLQAANSAVDRPVFRRFRVTAVRDESRSIRSFQLQPDDGAGLVPHRPGQHLVVRGRPRDAAEATLHCYTLSAAADGKSLQISVKREAGQGLSAWLHRDVAPGQTLEVLAPRGQFFWAGDSGRPLVLLSAGVGITPMMAILQAATVNNGSTVQPREIVFIHGARNAEEQAFGAQMRALAARHPKVRLHLRHSAPQGDGGGHDSVGRIDQALIDTLVGPLGDCEVYLCGPAAFMTSAAEWLRALGLAPDRIRMESFGGAQVPARAGGAMPGPDHATVHFSTSGRSAAWQPGSMSLLDLAEREGLAIPNDCRAGICGQCAVRMTVGHVAYDTEPAVALMPDSILLCCARPQSEVLHLEC